MPICTPIGSFSINAMKCSASARASARRSRRSFSGRSSRPTRPLRKKRSISDAEIKLTIAGCRRRYVSLRWRNTSISSPICASACSLLPLSGTDSRRTSLSADIERIGGKHIGDRAGQNDDVLGGFLDLPHAFEIADRRGDIFDAHAQQGRHRDLQQLGEVLQRFDLGDFALFKAIERSTRNAELLRDLLGRQPRAKAKGFQPVAYVVEAQRHLATHPFRHCPARPGNPCGMRLARALFDALIRRTSAWTTGSSRW